MREVFFVLCLVVFGQACIEAGSDESSTFQVRTPLELEPDDRVSFEQVRTSLMEPLCLRCHAWSVDEEKVRERIVAGSPEDSHLYRLVEGEQMPPRGPFADLEQLDLLRRYILDLALAE